MYVTRDVVFHENVFFFGHECSLQGEKKYNLDEEITHEMHESQDENDNGGSVTHETHESQDENNNGGSFENLAPEIADYDSQSDGEINGENEDGNEQNTEDNDTTNGSRDSTHPVTNPIENPEVIDTPNASFLQNEIPDFVLQETNNTPEPRYLARHNRGIPKKQYQLDLEAKANYPIGDYVSSHRLARSHALLVEELSTVKIPNNVQEALKDEKWKNAMNQEMEALQKNQTWELMSLPPWKKTVGCRWVYTIKLDSMGNIDQYKVRLVAKGYT